MEKQEILSDIYKLQLKKAALDKSIEEHKAHTLNVSELASQVTEKTHLLKSLEDQITLVKEELIKNKALADTLKQEVSENQGLLKEIKDHRTNMGVIKASLVQIELDKGVAATEYKKILADTEAAKSKHQDTLDALEKERQGVEAHHIDEKVKHEKYIDALKLKEQELIASLSAKSNFVK